ncbi:MAG: precorrin-6y C5,15-methyltransferase (decarboxylating) subunit CbiE [Xanthobacteraceae bacterium]|nr:precorrin-6y C5,15-methyltransferase (decarboxylating) subunit CbiE [Xanthobacteraceae bacterium]
MTFADPVSAKNAASARWLSIVGIGEDGVAALSPAARALVESAEVVFGGQRHLALAGTLIHGRARAWPTPFGRAVADVLGERPKRVCVLASGDPFHYGIGAQLARQVPPAEMVTVPAPSAFSLSAARLGWPLAVTTLLALNGRALDLIRPHLHPGARILALSAGAETPGALAQLLVTTGFGQSRLIILEALGGARERVRSALAANFDLAAIDPLNTIGIEVVAGVQARIIPRAPGLADSLFEHDGQITKREIRTLTLSALAPRRGERLWDVGAGAGSVAIEWMLADSSLRALAVEADTERAARIARNAAALGVPGLEIVHAPAPAALAGLARPDAIFIGGGASEPGVLDRCFEALPAGGRLVVNAVTLATEALLMAQHAELGGELTRIAIARAEPLGDKTGWRPAMPITQWSWTKP